MQSIRQTSLYDLALERYPVPYESRFVPTSLGATHVLLSGDPLAPPLVLIHGAGMNALAWIRQVAALSVSNRVIAVDLPGQSGKSDVRRLPLTGIGTANWLSSLLNALGIARARILGGSLGGWVALKFAATYPARVEKLVLIAPGGIVGVNWPAFLSFAPALLTRSPIGMAALIQRMAHKRIEDEALTFLAQMVAVQPLRTAVIPNVISDGELRRVSAPVLVILGLGDQVFLTLKLRTRVNTVLSHAEVVTLDACGHLIPYDQPEALLRAVIPFLEAVHPGRNLSERGS